MKDNSRSAVQWKAGRGWAYLSLIAGGVVSIRANVAHTYLVNPTPAVDAVALAVFWPIALFLAVEMLARVDWSISPGARVIRWVGVTPVAVVAGVVSYRHLSGLLSHYGEDPVTAALGPLAVDGLMVMATAALILTRPEAAEVEARQPLSKPAGVPSKPRKASGKKAGAGERIARAMEANPGATQAQIARLAKTTDRTVRRHINTQQHDNNNHVEVAA